MWFDTSCAVWQLSRSAPLTRVVRHLVCSLAIVSRCAVNTRGSTPHTCSLAAVSWCFVCKTALFSFPTLLWVITDYSAAHCVLMVSGCSSLSVAHRARSAQGCVVLVSNNLMSNDLTDYGAPQCDAVMFSTGCSVAVMVISVLTPWHTPAVD